MLLNRSFKYGFFVFIMPSLRSSAYSAVRLYFRFRQTYISRLSRAVTKISKLLGSGTVISSCGAVTPYMPSQNLALPAVPSIVLRRLTPWFDEGTKGRPASSEPTR